MADLDDIRDGKNYGVGMAQKNDGFFLKGSNNLDWGMKDRLSRIFNPATGKTVMLAFDHGFIMGPTSGVERIDLSIVPLIEYADCLMCARGVLRTLVPPTSRKPICLRSTPVPGSLFTRPCMRVSVCQCWRPWHRGHRSSLPTALHCQKSSAPPLFRFTRKTLPPWQPRSPAPCKTTPGGPRPVTQDWHAQHNSAGNAAYKRPFGSTSN